PTSARTVATGTELAADLDPFVQLLRARTSRNTSVEFYAPSSGDTVGEAKGSGAASRVIPSNLSSASTAIPAAESSPNLGHAGVIGVQ
ncbi:unnamed protein product, partial [Discosporangium mesarthrocarpum]